MLSSKLQTGLDMYWLKQGDTSGTAGFESLAAQCVTDGSLLALFHCMVRYGSARLGTVRYGSVAFPPQFSTAIEWAGLFTRRYNCAASTAVTSS